MSLRGTRGQFFSVSRWMYLRVTNPSNQRWKAARIASLVLYCLWNRSHITGNSRLSKNSLVSELFRQVNIRSAPSSTWVETVVRRSRRHINTRKSYTGKSFLPSSNASAMRFQVPKGTRWEMRAEGKTTVF